MLDITIEGLDELRSYLAVLPENFKNALFSKSQSLADLLKDKIQANLNGDVINSKSGALRDSINNEVIEDDQGISSSVFVDGDIPYAAILEYGGVTKAHIIEVKNAKTLAFTFNGKTMFAKSVNHPGSVFPERSYMRSALADLNDDIQSGFADSLQEVI